MILFVSDGRLGNQLFQYAFLKQIAHPRERIIGFRMGGLRSVFELRDKRFYKPDLSARGFRLFQKIIQPFLLMLGKTGLISILEESISEGRPDGGLKKSRGILPFRFVRTAFFQSERFLDTNQFDIEFKADFIEEAKKLMREMPRDFESVFVHIRRGDYLKEEFKGVRGIELPLNYYSQAISKIKSEVARPFFFFVSDDPEFCESNFQEIEHRLISRAELGVDLAIMSLCEYGIIANSSFSWWGAFLMAEKKQVYYPRYWYGWKVKTHSHPAIYPSFGEEIKFD